jgi:hypothetical protein
MNAARTLAGFGFVAMGAALVYGFTAGDFFAEGRLLVSIPWGIVSLVDVYVGFALFSGWIAFREASAVRAAGWILLVVILGNLTASLYVLVALARSREDWTHFWQGARRPLAN